MTKSRWCRQRYLEVVQALLQLTVGRTELLLKLLLCARVILVQLIAIKIHVFLELLILWRHRQNRVEP